MASDEGLLKAVLDAALPNRTATVRDVIASKRLASIGDGLVNLAVSLSSRAPGSRDVTRAKVGNKFLKQAAKRSLLAAALPTRISTHETGNAVEAALAFGWLSGYVSLDQIVHSFSQEETDIRLAHLLDTVTERARWFVEAGDQDNRNR